MYTGLHVKYLLFLSKFDETRIFSTYFQTVLKFHENPSSGSRVVPHRQADVTKPTVSFHSVVQTPNE